MTAYHTGPPRQPPTTMATRHDAPPPPLQRDNSLQLSWHCEEQLYRQEVASADDLRLSVRLRTKCASDKRKFCSSVKPGGCGLRGLG